MKKYFTIAILFMALKSSAQNVGIGTTTPSAKLDIINTTNSGYTLKIRPANANGQVWMDSVGNIKMYDPANTAIIPIYDSARLNIARTYNISTNTFVKAMNVTANFINGGGSAIVGSVFGNATNMGNSPFAAITGYNFIDHSLANGVQGQSTGAYGVFGTTFAVGKAGVYGYSFQGRGIEGASYNDIEPGGYFSGNKYALITASGQVGIGTNTPTAKLELNSQNVSGDAFRLTNKSGLLSAMFDSSGRMLLGDLASINLYNDTSKLFINNQIGNATNKNGINIISNTTGGFGTGIKSVINGTTPYQNAAINAEDNTIIPGFGGGIGVNSFSNAGYSIFSQSYSGYGAVISSTLGVGASIATQSGTGVIINTVAGLNALEVKNGNTGIGTSVTDAKLHIKPENGNKKIIKVQDFNNNEKLRMDSSGRILVGDIAAIPSNNDTSKMSIYANVNTSSNKARPSLLIKTNVQNGYASGVYSQLNSTGVASAAIYGEDITDHTDNYGVIGNSKFGAGVYGYSESGIAGLFTNETGLAALVANGKVGIGISTPQSNLHIHSANSFLSSLRLTNMGTGAGIDDGLRINTAGSACTIGFKSASPISFYTNNKTVMQFNQSGKIAVGDQSTPQAILDISPPIFNSDYLIIKKYLGNVKLKIDSLGNLKIGDLTNTETQVPFTKLLIINNVDNNTGSLQRGVNIVTNLSQGNFQGVESVVNNTGLGIAEAFRGSVFGNGTGVTGTSTGGLGVNGQSNTGTGGDFSSSSGVALKATTNTGPYAIEAIGNVSISGKIINEAWKTPTLNAGWNNYGGSYVGVSYYKDKENRVHLRGLLNTGTVGSTIFVLDPLYRPVGGTLMFNVNNGNAQGRIDIDVNGNVVFTVGPASGTWVSLDGVSFRAD